MNIMELGALGEFVGAIAVVTTLVYLAVQIRQNTRTMKTSALRSVQDLILLTEKNERYIAYLMKSQRNEELALEERAHMVERLLTIMRTFERIWYEHRLGAVSKAQFEQNLDLLRWALSAQVARQMWAHLAEAFDPEFRTVVDSEVLGEQAPTSSMLKAFTALNARPTTDRN